MTLKVLIVEENPVARQFLLRVVRESFSDGIDFSEAQDPLSAQALMARASAAGQPSGFRLILCDIEQSDGSGLEWLATLRPDPAIKVATTLHSDDEHLFPALQCGAQGYLLKEDRFEVLVEELQKIVRGQPPLSPAMARRVLGFFRGQVTHKPAHGLRTTPADGFAHSMFGATDPPDDALTLLTEREADLLGLLSKGYTVKEISHTMSIPWFAVNDHIRTVYRKLEKASSPAEALRQLRRELSD
jgi:two-component system, NarL family, nitrate/nitrite response regulator NarL